MGTILDGTAYCTFSVGEHMIDTGGGSIIVMGATNSVQGAPFHAHSGAGKAGVHNLMQSVAAEWGRYGIRANTVAPGFIDTEGVEKVRRKAATPARTRSSGRSRPTAPGGPPTVSRSPRSSPATPRRT